MSYFLNDQTEIDFTVSADTLGPNDLILQKFEGTEALSAPFEFHATFQSSNNSIAVDSVIGKSVTIKIKTDDGERYFNGIFGRFIQGATAIDDAEADLTFYHAVIYPTLWKLKFSADCKIYQHKSALDIIKAVFSDNDVTIQDKTQGAGAGERAYCVQYNESHFNFVSRLMEAEGIFYYFEHADGSHTMILADDGGVHKPCENADTVEMALSQQETMPFNTVGDATYQAQLVTSDFQHVDFDYKKPSTQLLSQVSGGGDSTFGQVYEYPGDFLVSDDGDGFANIHLQEKEALKLTLSGTSAVPFFVPGYNFTLKKHPRSDLNAKYILSSVTHFLDVQPLVGQAAGVGSLVSYKNTFTAFPDGVTFRSPRLSKRPKIAGTQTAIVTGKSGEEIWTDKYGRIKVKFHWDQEGADDETSSCWVRVAQGWASSGWGILFTPRVGMEVVVSFICGDPDRPLVTGVVYNADNLPPYLPDEPTKSTIFSNTSKDGDGFNELRFDDKKDNEEIWIHAQKDMNIDVINNRSAVIEKGDDSLEIQKGSRTTTIKKDYTKTLLEGDETVLLKKGDRSITLKKGDETKEIKKGSYTRKVKKDYTLEIGGDMTVKVKGDILIKVNGGYTLKIGADGLIKAAQGMTMKSGTDTTVQSGTDMTVKSGTGLTVKSGTDATIKSGTNMSVKAGVNLEAEGSVNATFKAGAMGKVEAGAMQEVKSSMVKIGTMVKLG